MKQKNLFLKGVLYGIIWFLFLTYVFPNIFVTIDPCSSTPGNDYANSFFIIPLYCILFCALGMYYTNNIFNKNQERYTYIFLIVVIIPSFSLFISFQLVSSINENWLLNNGLWDYFYKAGCYNDSEIKELIPNIIASLLLLLSSYFILLKKQNP